MSTEKIGFLYVLNGQKFKLKAEKNSTCHRQNTLFHTSQQRPEAAIPW